MNTATGRDNTTIVYTFTLPDGDRESFQVAFPSDLPVLRPVPPGPDWARLEHHRCPHCPVSPEAYSGFCPVALNIAPVADRFETLTSCDTLRLEVETAERVISQTTSVQKALGSLLGLLIAASPCPHTDFFKPMARFHLPLASEEETVYRAAANFMLACYFHGKARPTEENLAELDRIYRNIQVINVSMAARIRSVTTTDSTVNAVVFLDMYAKSMPYVIKTALAEIRPLFAPYLASSATGGTP